MRELFPHCNQVTGVLPLPIERGAPGRGAGFGYECATPEIIELENVPIGEAERGYGDGRRRGTAIRTA